MFGLILPASAADPTAPEQSAAQVDQPQATQNQIPADADKGQTGQENAKKHPPTSVMDRAAPTDKATGESPNKGERGPTSVMERATPDLKSPGSTTKESQGSTEAAPDASATK